MAKYKIWITKSIEEEIEAENEEQAVDSAWEIFSQTQCEIYVEQKEEQTKRRSTASFYFT